MAEGAEALTDAIRAAGERLTAVASRLEALGPGPPSPADWLRVRAEVGRLMSEFHAATAAVDVILGSTSAKGRLLEYFRMNLGRVVTMAELSGVAGISEWAR